ncbi:WD repeat-containing protein 49-like isoform X2 [Symsagittifera roscoffensis]|uniref:WD repeat-containing protein 49-like isoform X2 n=1 Tax=Symsagittifera roscoffensis TaxID=84072 RepID=UPI00307B2D66
MPVAVSGHKLSTAVKVGLKSGTSAGESSDTTKTEVDLENLLTTADLEEIYAALQAEGNGYDNRLSLDRSQLKEFLTIVIRKGSEEQFNEFFDKVDATKLGKIDWYRIADHIFSEFEGKDDKNKQTTVPNWRPKRELQQNPHRDVIQKLIWWDKLKKYISVSKEGVVALWNEHNCELSHAKKLIPDNIKQRDLWVTDCVLMSGLGKLAMSNTCKEICIYDLNTKMEFPCVYRIHNLRNTPYSLHFWQSSANPNVSILSLGDTKGRIFCLNFEQSTVTLFDRPPKPAGEEKESTLQVDFQELEMADPPFEKEKENRICWLSWHQWHQPEHCKRYLQEEARRINMRNSTNNVNNNSSNFGVMTKTDVGSDKKDQVVPIRKVAIATASGIKPGGRADSAKKQSRSPQPQPGGTERQMTEVMEEQMKKAIVELDIWARQVEYIAHLDCVISCTTTTESSLVLAWRKPGVMKYLPPLKLTGGVHAFDFNEETNLIGIACADRNVYLYNPFVMSKPAGVLRGHMAAVIAVQFNKRRNHILSFSKDRVLRVWDVVQQISLQRIAGLLSTCTIDITARLFFHSDKSRLMIAIDSSLIVMQLKPEVKNAVTSHENPVTAAKFLDQNQIISSDNGGNVYLWRIDSGKRSKKFTSLHNGMDISCMALRDDRTRFFTGSSDGTVKEWDVAGNIRRTFLVDVESNNSGDTSRPVAALGAASVDRLVSGTSKAQMKEAAKQSRFSSVTKRNVVHASSNKRGRPAEVLNVILLKREILAVGWERSVCMFRPGEVEDGATGTKVEWKGEAVHSEDIVTAAFASPITLATGSLDGEIVVWNMNSQSPSKFLRERKRVPTNVLQQGHTHGTDSPAVSSSRRDSIMSNQEAAGEGRESRSLPSKAAHEEEREEFAVSTLTFIESRMGSKRLLASGVANLISCGAGGWVRFWSTVTGKLCAEFCAHPEVTSITMRLDDEDNSRLVTADTDGYLKVWDIEHYAMNTEEYFLDEAPVCVDEWQAHEDAISTVDMMKYLSEELWLILSCSVDLTINLWTIDGTHIGVFGQDNAWKIRKMSPLDNMEDDKEEINENRSESRKTSDNLETQSLTLSQLSDSQIVELLKKYVKIVDEDLIRERFDVWKTTSLGVRYSEDRAAKRERKQPSFQRDFPYLYSDSMGKPAFGPHYSLDTPELEDTAQSMPEKPKSITDDSLMRSADAATDDQLHQQRLDISTPPKHKFEERNLFTRSMLQRDHEKKLSKAQETRRGTMWNIHQRSAAGSKMSTAKISVASQQKKVSTASQMGASMAPKSRLTSVASKQ